MKGIISFLLIFTVILGTISKTAIVVHYIYNKQEIASFQCENRFKPELHCEGKCVVKKQISKETKACGLAKIFKETGDWLLCKESFEFFSLIVYYLIELHSPVQKTVVGYSVIFHPPPSAI